MQQKMTDRYYRFSQYLRERFGCRVRKVSVDAGFSCPNRDGTLGTTGCIYCDNQGFSMNTRAETKPLDIQIEEGIAHAKKYTKAEKFIVYFQAFTNTYAPVDELKRKYDTIRKFKDVVALAIGTRPDCVNEEVLDLIDSYTSDFEVWIEYGLQSMHDDTLKRINRHHTFSDFMKAVTLTRTFKKIKICTHVILGLPGETDEAVIETAKALGELKIEGIKIHPLHIIKNTVLETSYNNGTYKPLLCENYVNLVIQFLEYISPKTVIQRITADCPRDLLIAPHWLHEKTTVLRKIDERMHELNTYQGNKVPN